MEDGAVEKPLSREERVAALSRVSISLMSELDEKRLLQLIAETACRLTGAQFAAFSLRPTDEAGQPLVPAEGHLFHLAAVSGVTKEQEALFRRTPLGGEGLAGPYLSSWGRSPCFRCARSYSPFLLILPRPMN